MNPQNDNGTNLPPPQPSLPVVPLVPPTLLPIPDVPFPPATNVISQSEGGNSPKSSGSKKKVILITSSILVGFLLIAGVVFFVTRLGSFRGDIRQRAQESGTTGSSSSSSSSSTSSTSSVPATNQVITLDKLGIGECHSSSSITQNEVRWFYPIVYWSLFEPTEGNYNFSLYDTEIAKARRAGKKIWLALVVSNPDSPETNPSIPQWLIDKGMHVVNKGIPIQWDPLYLEYHEKALKALANRYDKPEYHDVVTAVIMQSGGNFGEMTLGYNYCAGSAPAGTKADVEDPNNIYVREMARVFLGSESRSSEMVGRDSKGYVFDTYYIEAVKRIIDIYANSFKNLPVAIQIGTGISCQGRVFQESVDYAITKYGNHFWIKFNGLGSFNEQGSSSFYLTYRTRTFTSYEMGHPSNFCAAEGGYQKGGGYNQCKWDTRQQAIDHNNQVMDYAINSGVTSVCFQGVFFEDRQKYPLDYASLKTRLESNFISNLSSIRQVSGSGSSSSSSSSSRSSSISSASSLSSRSSSSSLSSVASSANSSLSSQSSSSSSLSSASSRSSSTISSRASSSSSISSFSTSSGSSSSSSITNSVSSYRSSSLSSSLTNTPTPSSLPNAGSTTPMVILIGGILMIVLGFIAAI